MITSSRSALAGALTLFLINSCVYKEIPTGPTCTGSNISIAAVSTTPATTCTSADGQLEVAGSGGTAPYQYAINGGALQSNPVFTALSAGTYALSVSDAIGCTSSVDIVIAASNSTLAATSSSSPDSNCSDPHNGSINVLATGGTPPYEFSIDNGVFGLAATFNNQTAGAHKVDVKDAGGCVIILNITVPRGDTGISYASQIQPIINASCNFSSCHGAGNGSRDFTNFANVTAKATSIKTRTGNLSMPPGGSADLSSQQIQLIACWVDDGAKNN